MSHIIISNEPKFSGENIEENLKRFLEYHRDIPPTAETYIKEKRKQAINNAFLDYLKDRDKSHEVIKFINEKLTLYGIGNYMQFTWKDNKIGLQVRKEIEIISKIIKNANNFFK